MRISCTERRLPLIFADRTRIIELMTGKTRLQMRSLAAAERLAGRQKRLARLSSIYRSRLERTRNLRIGLAAVFFLVLVYFASQPRLVFELPVIAAFLAVFTILVLRTRRIECHLRNLDALKAFFERQERRCLGLISGRGWESAEKQIREQDVPVAHDLDLFGPHSLWSLLDETLTDQGEAQLASWITASPMTNKEIHARQELIRSLRSEYWFFTRWTLHASRADFRLSSSEILRFLKTPFVKPEFPYLLLASILTWFVSFSSLVLKTAGWSSIPVILVFVFPVVNLAALFKVGSPFLKGVGLSHHLSELEPVFKELENRASRIEKLKRLAPVVAASGPSRESRKLGRVLAFMSIQANPLLHIFTSILLPWSLAATYFLERRRKKIAYTFPQCLSELAELEALGSLVLFDRYQTDSYPQIQSPSSQPPKLVFSGLFHPLIDRKRVVANDFSFPAGKRLGLITGSNMSGKSTFLRTIGLNQVLANMGAPVFADSFSTYPLEVETCIEVSDSLRDGFSYFYAEVRRLKELLNRVSRRGTHVLYLIDEIFRGTNNRERQIGSRALIRALAHEPGSVGFISTHDLELTNLEESHDQVMNLHFREDFSAEGEMVFSYKLRLGPCPTTNALKIMAREGLPIE